MQLGDILCYALLTITVAASCVRGEEETRERDLTEHKVKKINKRDASLIIGNFPVEPIYSQKPKVIYRRISHQRYGPPKSKYKTHRPKYGPPPPKSKTPTKKYRKRLSYKYGHHSKHRSPKPRYGPPKRPVKKPVYGPPKKVHPSYNVEPAGFAEPPADIEPQQPPPKHNYAEPPVDSYGAPLKIPDDIYPTAYSYDKYQNQFEQNDFTNVAQDYHPWQDFPPETNVDNSFANSKKRPIFLKPDELFDTQIDQEDEESHAYPDVHTFHRYIEPEYLSNRKKKPQFFVDSNKKVNKYWKSPRFRPGKVEEEDDEILVGGQYAEPPARYVPKFQPSAPMFTGSDDFTPARAFENYHVVTTSGTVSPYVNYINSNMAFSPQNLNDAFSSR